MPNVLVRDIDDSLLANIKARAKENGRSLQGELLFIIRQFAQPLPDAEIAERIKEALRGRTFSDSADLLREDRGR